MKKVWEVNVTEQATLTVKYSAYPDPSFKWYVHSRRKSSFTWSYTSLTVSSVALLCSVMSVRLKNGQTLKDDYRIKQRSDSLIIRGVTEMDAGNYTIVLTNKITKEEQRRSFQLLVNSMYSLLFPFFLLL